MDEVRKGVRATRVSSQSDSRLANTCAVGLDAARERWRQAGGERPTGVFIGEDGTMPFDGLYYEEAMDWALGDFFEQGERHHPGGVRAFPNSNSSARSNPPGHPSFFRQNRFFPFVLPSDVSRPCALGLPGEHARRILSETPTREDRRGRLDGRMGAAKNATEEVRQGQEAPQAQGRPLTG